MPKPKPKQSKNEKSSAPEKSMANTTFVNDFRHLLIGRTSDEQSFPQATEELLHRVLSAVYAVMHRLESVLTSAPAATNIRAADALHLACAAEHGFKEVYSNDRLFLAAAPLFELHGVNVIPTT
jgi:predicted nucleic acid-binding protein